MQRIIILGCPGAGKSTLARRIGEAIDIPVHHLDRYYWNPGWKASAPDEWLAKLQNLIDRDRWILDGNYRSTIPMRLERADTAIYLDFPRRTALWRLMKRIFTYGGSTRPDMTEGCPERWFDIEFLGYVWRFNEIVRPQVLDWLNEFAAQPGRTVITLKSDRELEQWLNGLHESPVSTTSGAGNR